MSRSRPGFFVALVAAALGGCAVYDAVPVDPSDVGGGGGVGRGATTSTGAAGLGGEVSDGVGGAGTTSGGAGTASGGDGVVTIDAGSPDPEHEVPDTAPDTADRPAVDARPADAAAEREPSTTVATDGPSDAPGECIRETRSSFCLRIGKNCGPVAGADNCGMAISVDCGICVPLEGCGGTGIPNVCGAPPNLAQGGTVTSSHVGITPEEMTKAFDGDGLTKWFASTTKTPWIAYQFGQSAAHVVNSYGVASANDFPVRDPSAWRLEGSNDGTTWVTLDTRVGQTFVNRFQTSIYPCANTTAYSRYRFSVTANNGSPDTQVAEILLFGE